MNIIELAKEACAPNQTFNSDPEWVERFAALVRAEAYQQGRDDMKEEAAKVCDKYAADPDDDHNLSMLCAAAIRKLK